jgi:cytidyltransferase-like protein
MILDFNKLCDLRKHVTMVDGGFDPIHLGHIEYFKEAKKLGLPVLCCMACDQYICTKHKPLLPEDYRAGIISAIRYIEHVHINQRTTAEVLAELQPAFYAKGKDWEGRLPKSELEACDKYGIKVVYLNTILDSSSLILRRYNKGAQ